MKVGDLVRYRRRPHPNDCKSLPLASQREWTNTRSGFQFSMAKMVGIILRLLGMRAIGRSVKVGDLVRHNGGGGEPPLLVSLSENTQNITTGKF